MTIEADSPHSDRHFDDFEGDLDTSTTDELNPDEAGSQSGIGSLYPSEIYIEPRNTEYTIRDPSGPDPVDLYFSEVSQISLLTAEEEVVLAKKIEEGREAEELLNTRKHADGPKLISTRDAGVQAKNDLVQANSRLVIAMAKRYRNSGVPFLDLIQEGNLGLIKAAEKFDWRRGNKFSTYAVWWVRQQLTRAIYDQSRAVRVPVHLSRNIGQVYAVYQRLEKEQGKRPTPAEIAQELGMSEAQVEKVLKASRKQISLNKPVGDGSVLEDFIPDGEAEDFTRGVNIELLTREVEDILSALTAREARVIELRHGLNGHHNHNLEEIGAKFGLTRERVRQIEQEALNKLREPHRSQRLEDY